MRRIIACSVAFAFAAATMIGAGAGVAFANSGNGTSGSSGSSGPSPYGANCLGDSTSTVARAEGGIGTIFANTPNERQVQVGIGSLRFVCAQPKFTP